MSSKKGQFVAEVISNRKIGKCFYTIALRFSGEGAVAFSKTIPGQFCQINLAGVALPPEDDISEHLRDSCTRNIL
ncbi:MAG: hypothetical protein PHF37_08030, partial [Phycisphaerae bacterium]|nr:hypothetical protein [Phycisphaerae bacterium]